MLIRALAAILATVLLAPPASAAPAPAASANDPGLANALYAAKGKLEPTKALLGQGADSGAALNTACYFGELDTAHYLIDVKKVSVDARDASAKTPLISATNIVHPAPLDLVRFLIDKGADVNAAGKDGDTPLINAAWHKKGVELAKLLIEKGAKVNVANRVDHWGKTALSEAIREENGDTARVLIEAGADVNAKSEGDPVLYRASLRGQMDLVRLLLDHGADPNMPERNGDLPFSNAIREPETAKLLLEHGANANAVLKRFGVPALEVLSSFLTGMKDDPKITEVVKLLIEHGANVNAVGKDGCTMLQIALGSNKPEIAKALVNAGADVKASDHCAQPLQIAAQRGQLDLVRLLFEAGSTEAAPDQYHVCNGFEPNGTYPSCQKDQILALLANPPAPVIKLAQIAKEMRETKVSSTLAAVPTAESRPAEPTSDADEPRYHAAERPHDLAVVVGIEKYNGGLPSASFAERDARAVRKHLLALGYAERNIFLLTGPDATRSGLVKNLETRLPALTKPDSTVFFYYSGHGAPDAETGKAYLLPVDGDPQFLKDTAYPLSQLYAALGKLPAKRVIVALDSCFPGAGGRSVIAKGTRPLVVKIDSGGALADKVVALTASAGSQTSGTIEAQGHGAFTYYLLRGLNGAAKGDDGAITLQSLFDYLEPNVEDAARRENRDQAPQLLRADSDRARRVVFR